MRNKRLLVISPHPDDGLLGAGATIAKYIENGWEVKYVILSWRDQGFNQEEIKNALSCLGIKESQQVFLNYEVRNFPYASSAIRQELVNLREDYKPDLVLIHNSHDFHQDHQIASQEGVRAFREKALWGYVLPWNLREFKFDMFVEVEEKYLKKKLEALKLLNSQKWRFYYNLDRIKALAVAFGTFRRREYAEPFEILSEIK